jgi:hypothetical protein
VIECLHEPSRAGKKQEPTQPEQLHHALKHGMPNGERLRFFSNFVVSFDARTRNPRWVLEHITREQTRGDGNRCSPRVRASTPWRSKNIVLVFSLLHHRHASANARRPQRMPADCAAGEHKGTS